MTTGPTPRPGISNLGSDAESQFRALTGALPVPRASMGDAVLDGHLVEIKRATSTTLNQVRAVKYITLVAFHVPTSRWYVIPACDVVRLVAGKTRGQHTENPFESATISITNLGAFQVADPLDLRNATLAAVEKSASRPDLAEAMTWVLAESKRLAADSCTRVTALLRPDDLFS